MNDHRAARVIAEELRALGVRCNCDLDNWEPEPDTGHSWVCTIHRQAHVAKHGRFDGRLQRPRPERGDSAGPEHEEERP